MKIRFAPMACLFFSLTACGPQGDHSVRTDGLESLDVLRLKLHARQNDVNRFKQRLESAPAHSRFKAEADWDGVQERLTAARLKLDALNSVDVHDQPQAQADFHETLSELTRFLREIEQRYGTNNK
ncbi:MAG: hypothetical protein JNK54_09625 [Elusimicrobia bacterium]|nr:hypothetical protein [Elusimicrobiota bacterium]